MDGNCFQKVRFSFRLISKQLLDNARVAAGLLEDPRAMLTRLNQLLEKVLAKE